jgi:two-component system, LytTR family, response regulator
MKIAIIEDNPHFIKQLEVLISQWGSNASIEFIGHSVEDAVDVLSNPNIDLALLDIHIQGETIFDALSIVESLSCHILFITSFEEYAIKAFKFSAIDFLVKPIDEMEFLESLTNAQSKLDQSKEIYSLRKQLDILERKLNKQEGEASISVATEAGTSFFKVKDILYIQAEGAYCSFYLLGGERFVVSKTMKYYADVLLEEGFIKPHKSFVVNQGYVKKMKSGEESEIILNNDVTIPVSRRRKQEIKNQLFS